MMENAVRPVVEFGGATPPGYDLEFYTSPASSARFKDGGVATNNNVIMPERGGAGLNNSGASTSSSDFSIRVSTEPDQFIDELMELTDENVSTASSSAVSTPSPVWKPTATESSKPVVIGKGHPVLDRTKSHDSTIAGRPFASAPTTLPFHSKLHEALTQPNPRLLTTQQPPVKCNRCGDELTSRCLMQTCSRSDDNTKCVECGRDLTTKCLLAKCSTGPTSSTATLTSQNASADCFDGSKALLPPQRSTRVHHHSMPSKTSF